MNDNRVLQMHAETAEIIMETAKVAMTAFRAVADQLCSLRNIVTDVVGTPDMEHNKREMLALWVEVAGYLRAAAELANNGPMPATEFRDEIKELLCSGFVASGAVIDEKLANLCAERANNIAQAYSGRVLRERE